MNAAQLPILHLIHLAHPAAGDESNHGEAGVNQVAGLQDCRSPASTPGVLPG